MEGEHSLEVRWKWSTKSEMEGEHQESGGRGAPGVRWKGSTVSQMERSHSDHLRGLDIFGKELWLKSRPGAWPGSPTRAFAHVHTQSHCRRSLQLFPTATPVNAWWTQSPTGHTTACQAGLQRPRPIAQLTLFPPRPSVGRESRSRPSGVRPHEGRGPLRGWPCPPCQPRCGSCLQGVEWALGTAPLSNTCADCYSGKFIKREQRLWNR